MRTLALPRGLLDSLRQTIAYRNEVAREIRAAANPHRQWLADRVNEVHHANAWIEAQSDRLGVEPSFLVELAEMD